MINIDSGGFSLNKVKVSIIQHERKNGIKSREVELSSPEIKQFVLEFGLYPYVPSGIPPRALIILPITLP